MQLSRLISIALIAQLLSAPLTSGMLVLCLGNDGHMAVESAGANPCCREREEIRQDRLDGGLATTIAPASGPCCSDVELSVESARLTVPSQKVQPASVLPCSAPVMGAPARMAAAHPFRLPAESPVAASLRTVVLRA